MYLILGDPGEFAETPERDRDIGRLGRLGKVIGEEHQLQATRLHEDVFDRSIDVQVLRLRRKLEADPGAPRIIQTERGVGYVFALPVERV